jgi:ribonuclease BN (tRNA processing enzyme)
VERFLRFYENADVLIHDAQYTREQLKRRRGWGHSAWPDVLDIAVDAGVKRLILFHHDPDHSDSVLDEMNAAVQRRLATMGATLKCSLAREGDLLIV